MKFSGNLLAACLAASGHLTGVLAAARNPNIVFIFTDDQDYLHGSLDHMPALQKHLVDKGTTFTNHYATIAVCCPSRVSLMRGQAAHNTNNTQVSSPGGGYPKFLASLENNDYLPHWITQAGYQAEYIGKLFNGNSLINYSPGPKGWSHNDILLDPYINVHNSIVMSANGEKPMYYEGWQQLDVLRVKSLARLQHLMAEEDHDPFFLMIAPSAPHVENRTAPPSPPLRYKNKFANLTLPYRANFNPPDELHQDRPSWWAGLPRLNSTQIEEVNLLYQRRSETMLGVDDIVADVVDMLEQKGELDNTYIIFSTDQGYHLGTHRDVGKCSPYIEDANIPLVVRGPGVEEGAVSELPSTVTDFAPTFLEIAGLAEEDRPVFLDGTSMLEGWKNPQDQSIGKSKEAINVEFWGRAYTEIPTWAGGDDYPGLYKNNTYKTMRIVAEEYAWVYSRWCTGDTELYDSKSDPFELTNLAKSTDPDLERVKSRLNALLMVMKSCEADTCRNPWSVLQPARNGTAKAISSLGESLDPAYDAFFATIPQVNIAECVQYQYAPNEVPFYPPEAQFGLGTAHRDPLADGVFEYPDVDPVAQVPYVAGGGWEQRNATLEMLLRDARPLSDDELQQKWNVTSCNEGQECSINPKDLLL
ncbi:arylsulfatase [Xylariomycetidae sp. FL0641]|nr:arylsulfatase [Xylariomycetidae sp. FL0641]